MGEIFSARFLRFSVDLIITSESTYRLDLEENDSVETVFRPVGLRFVSHSKTGLWYVTLMLIERFERRFLWK